MCRIQLTVFLLFIYSLLLWCRDLLAGLKLQFANHKNDEILLDVHFKVADL